MAIREGTEIGLTQSAQGQTARREEDAFIVRITETNVWTTTIMAGSAEEAEQKAERTTRG